MHRFVVAACIAAALMTGCGGGSGASTPAGTPANNAPQPSIALLAGSATESGSLDGSALQARFHSPVTANAMQPAAHVVVVQGPGPIAADAAGNIYLRDLGIRRIAADGTVKSLPAIASANPYFTEHLGVDAGGSAYFDALASIFRQPLSAEPVEYLAGAYAHCGFFCAILPSPSLAQPFVATGPFAFDSAGVLTMVDGFLVRRITSDGHSQIVVDLSGRALGGATALVRDDAGNLYMTTAEMPSDYGGMAVRGTNRAQVVKVSAAGEVSVLAGPSSGVGFSDGRGDAALFDNPVGIARDTDGSLYVADMKNHAIRKIDTNGQVTTVAGTPGVAGFEFGALPGKLTSPAGIAWIAPKTFAVTTGAAVVRIVVP